MGTITITAPGGTAVTILALALLCTCLATSQAQDLPPTPPPRSLEEVHTVLDAVPDIASENLKDLRIVLLASEKDHGLHEHDYPLWQKNWSLLLGGEQSGSEATQINLYGPVNQVNAKEKAAGAPNVTVETAWEWPSVQQFETADLIVAFSVIDWTAEGNAQLDAYLSRGGAFVLVHMSCVVADGTGLDDEVVGLTGLSWHWDHSRWRHGPMNLDIVDPNHPICVGLPARLYFMDEAYWPLYGDRDKVTIIATSKESTRNFALRDSQGNLDFSNMAAIQMKWPEEPTRNEPMFWTYEYGKGRVFGCILGHYTWTFDDPYFRLLLLRGMAWAAGESPYRFDPLALRGATVK